MRVLLLNQFYPPDTAPTGQLLADIAHALADRGHEVHVVCSAGTYLGGSRISPQISQPEEDGVWVHRMYAFSLGRHRALSRLCDWGSYYVLAAGECVRLGRFDACLALTTPPFIGSVGALLKTLRGTRLILWTMDLWPEVAEAVGTLRPGGHVSRGLRRLANWIYDRADAIVSLGPVMTQRLCDLGISKEKIINVHNWVPSKAARPLPSNQGRLASLERAGGFVVMYSGNMGAAHEFATIMAAADLLKDEQSIIFEFVGGGVRRQEVVREVQRRGLDNVHFLESVPPENLSELLAAAHVHLISLRPGLEGYVVPSKVYGILAAARPAIMVGSTRSEVAQLLTASGAGFVVDNGDAEGFASHIRAFRDQPSLAARMGEAGRQYYERHLGRDRSVAAILEAITRRGG